MSSQEDVIKVVETQEVEAEKSAAQKVENKRHRSKKYTKARSLVDKTKKFSAKEAVALVKKASYSKFAGTITLNALVREVGKQASVTLPHSTGKSIKVAIVDDALLEKIAAEQIDFDILVASPEYMPKLAKFARVLGPKGLMPNPKNGTVTPRPDIKKAELEKGTFDVKTEKKQPVLHVVVGKTSMSDEALTENIETLINALTGKVISASIVATMGSAVKLAI